MFLHTHACVEAAVLEGFEWVVGKITVADAEITVPQVFPGNTDTFDIIFQVEGVVNQEPDTVLLLQVKEHFLLIAQNQRDIRDAGLLKLPDLPLNQAFALHLEKPFRPFQGQGDEARGGPGRQNDRVADPVGLQRGQPRRSQRRGIQRDEACLCQGRKPLHRKRGTLMLQIPGADRPAHPSVVEIQQQGKVFPVHKQLSLSSGFVYDGSSSHNSPKLSISRISSLEQGHSSTW